MFAVSPYRVIQNTLQISRPNHLPVRVLWLPHLYVHCDANQTRGQGDTPSSHSIPTYSRSRLSVSRPCLVQASSCSSFTFLCLSRASRTRQLGIEVLPVADNINRRMPHSTVRPLKLSIPLRDSCRRYHLCRDVACLESENASSHGSVSVLAAGRHSFLFSVMNFHYSPRSRSLLAQGQAVENIPMWSEPKRHHEQKSRFVLKISLGESSEIRILEKNWYGLVELLS